MKMHGGVEVKLHTFLSSALDGDKWSASRPSRFTPGEIFRRLFDRGLGGPQIRSRCCDEEKSYPYRESNLGRPARNLVTPLKIPTVGISITFCWQNGGI
jgi:hypothetical protein